MTRAGSSLTVVIPTLNEAERLPRLLSDLEGLDAEIVVVDGGSEDATVDIAVERGVRVLEAERGRGLQFRAGVAASDRPWLFFLHADSRLDPSALTALRTFLEDARPDDFAHYRFALEGAGRLHRLIEFGQGLREACLGLPYGDQGLVVSRALYERASGYPAWPIMEDVGLVDRLGRLGRRVVLPARLVTSSRRYDAHGVLLGWLRNLTLIALFRLHVPVERLARWYAPHRGEGPRAQPPRNRRAVVVFAKAPIEGQAKTRLAAEVGAPSALRIYRALGRATMDALRGGPYRLIAYVDPPGPETLGIMSEWLGRDGVEYRFQSTGDLGARMASAFDECFEEADDVCLVGTDIPDIDQDTIRAAFDELGEKGVVLGPATDGGYYLVAMRKRHPELFTEIAWSTASVLESTLARASESGLEVALLEPKTDVDTRADVPASLLRE